MKSTPTKRYANLVRRIDFFTLAGAENLRIKEETWTPHGGATILTSGTTHVGRQVIGQWKQRLTEIHLSNPGRLAEEFANYPNDEQAILRFTKKYGPLQGLFPEPGLEFRFPPSEWQKLQKEFRAAWEGMEASKISTTIKNKLVIEHGLLRCETTVLLGLLKADLFSCARERFRKCRRPDCPNPYFVAHHLGQRFCSDLCGRWAQKKWKQQWWVEHGKDWRKAKAKRRTGLSKRSSKRTSRGEK